MEDAAGEQPSGPRHGSDFQNLHRNKRARSGGVSAACGKGRHGGREFSSRRQGPARHRLREPAAINPRLVYGSISGFGQDGPYHKRPGFDQIAQGMGGLMSITGAPGEGPMRVGIPVADLTAGLFCAIGILTALLERDVSGEGQWVQTSLLQAQIFMLDFQAARWLMEKDVAKQAGNNHPTSIPTGVFKASDGYINIATTGGRIWERCAQAIGAPELVTDPEYATAPARSKNRDALNAEISRFTEKKSTDTWVRELNAAGVPCGPIYSIDQMFEDDQASRHRPGCAKRGEPSHPSGRPAGYAVAHPEQNGSTAAGVRRTDRGGSCRVGFTAEEIGALRRDKVV
jgi:crotonobetainyl-CoA:carnitine CoA-transferase CaiB-like acyl-CoA transferase